MGDEVLEGYAAKLQLVFDHLAENEMLDEERFYTLLVESSVTPDPLPANSFVRIFNAGARGKALLTFDEFCECIERVSAKGLAGYSEGFSEGFSEGSAEWFSEGSAALLSESGKGVAGGVSPALAHAVVRADF